MGNGFTAVNVADNCHSIGMSSIAGRSRQWKSSGADLPNDYRDRNRIAISIWFARAAYLGLRTCCAYPLSSDVGDLPGISQCLWCRFYQLIEMVRIWEKGVLADGTKVEGNFNACGAVANPFLKPVELNMLRLQKKVDAGAKFIRPVPCLILKHSANGWGDD